MSMVPLKPLGREEIGRLESALMVATLFRPEVLEALRDSSTRLTWVDSLAVAAGAIARHKAGMTASKIADELGRSEATVREHMAGKTKAGKLVLETYEWLVKNQGRFEGIPLIEGDYLILKKEEADGLKNALAKVEEAVNKLVEGLKASQQVAEGLQKAVAEAKEKVKA